MLFGEKLRKLRRDRNLTQDQLGKILGSNGRHISKYENGQVLPAAETLVKIAEYFDVSIDYLLFDNSNKISSTNIQDKNLLVAFEAADKLEQEDRYIIQSLIDAFIKKSQLAQFLKSHSYI